MTIPPEMLSMVVAVSTALVCVMAYALFKQRVLRLALKPCGRAGFVGEALLVSGRLSEREAWSVKFRLDNMLNGWVPWIIVLLLPVYVVALALRAVQRPPEIANRTARFYHSIFSMDVVLTVFAQSPLAAAILVAELPFVIVVYSFVPGVSLWSSLFEILPGVEQDASRDKMPKMT